jgi:hypothetical protein
MKFNTLGKAEEAIGIRVCHLSRLIHGHRRPNWNEIEKLLRVFGPRDLQKFFPDPVPPRGDNLPRRPRTKPAAKIEVNAVNV